MVGGFYRSCMSQLPSSNRSTSERSYAELTRRDLERLHRLVGEAHKLYSANRPDLKGKLVAGCLAQGAAAHYADGKTGVKDLDLWLFYDARRLTTDMPNRTVRTLDFGPSHHGRHPADDSTVFTGRRVDAMARGVTDHLDDPSAAVRHWLAKTSQSAKLLRSRPVILVWPKPLLGTVL